MVSGTSGTDAALVPTGRKMKSYGCMRSLQRQGIRTVVASEFDRVPHFVSRYCSEAVQLAAGPDELTAYRDELLALAARSDVETIVPVREFDAYVLARYPDEFAAEVSLVVPPLDTLETAHDRLRLARAAERAGVPVANTRRLSAVDDWEGRQVVKSRYNLLADAYIDGFGPDDAEEVKDVRFLRSGEAPDAAALRAEMGHDPVVQAYVPQDEKILYCALWDDGEPLATYQHRQIRQNSWVGGGGVFRESTRSAAVEDAAATLLSHLDWHGLACIEYVRDARTGEYKFLEINPRVWQSLPEAVRAGADFPYYYWLAALGRPDQIDPDYEMGARCHIAYGEVVHLLSVLRDDSPFRERPSLAGTAWEIARSCVTDPRFDYVRRDDPRLFLAALRETLSSGVTSSRQYGSDDNGGAPHPSDRSRQPGQPSQSSESSQSDRPTQSDRPFRSDQSPQPDQSAESDQSSRASTDGGRTDC